ncbi:MAG: hypothetical protein US50_C0005G0001 [Candidatus Nomurabacteria bacterium GW2011_GWB1_37_5]|uniref:DUF5667 domain-containing protein n=1 Tax=Candidatus Nomurabacteria bacterium GW2011_GWB1_37_5 TaxID=1618742 RepID=A0A0G0HB66_9BACT|nr:MAG: hypothetical protein US50_C0005G0001 [Candidatus Nomurabacteria bacterium GW2011_GWB1_37_5]
MNKKISIILVVLFLCIFSFNTVRAQESEDISIEQEVKIENVGILPNSSWYFLKEFRRNVQKIFTFDRVKKVELQIKINDEKAEEISVLQEKDPENTVSIKKALINYLENEKSKFKIQNGLVIIGREPEESFIEVFNQYLHGIQIKTYRQLIDDCRNVINGFKVPVLQSGVLDK